jgi:magnesium transporter
MVEGLHLRAAHLEGGLIDAEIGIEELREHLAYSDGSFVWAHLIASDPVAARAYLEQLGFHELAIEDALSPHERPTFQEYPNHLFLTLSVIHQVGEEPEQFVELGVFIRNSAVVTVTRGECHLVEKWFERWKRSPDRIGSSPAWLVHGLIDAVVDEYFPTVDRLEDEVEALADRIYDDAPFELEEIHKLRRRLLEIRKRNSPTRDILNGMLRRDVEFFGPQLQPYLQDVYDHTLRIQEIIESNREALSSLMEAHMSLVSNNLNVVMKKMTVISTMLMIGALVAGIYGMNFRHMPELDSPFGYPAALGAMVFICGMAWELFRRAKWI